MLASKAFDNLLQQIQTSSLNYQIQISPFSALISLKKSLIKDKAGFPQLSPTPTWTSSYDHKRTDYLLTMNAKLEEEVLSLQKNYKDALKKSDVDQETIKALKSEMKVKNELKPVIIDPVSETTKAELKELREEKRILQGKIEERDDNINVLEHANKVAKEASNQLNKKLNEMKIKLNKEKAEILKEHKAELKAWKKDLGEANKENIKLRNKLGKLMSEKLPQPESSPVIALTEHQEHSAVENHEPQVVCSICSAPILDFKPKYFLGEAFNPACNDCDDSFEGDNTGPDPSGCKHTPVCVIRQPHPPPYPCITH